jgi:hypothetical protein
MLFSHSPQLLDQFPQLSVAHANLRVIGPLERTAGKRVRRP